MIAVNKQLSNVGYSVKYAWMGDRKGPTGLNPEILDFIKSLEN